MANKRSGERVVPLNNAFTSYTIIDDSNELDNLFDIISGKTLESFFKNLFSKASDGITSLRVYPMIKKSYFARFHEEYIQIANKEYKLYNAPVYWSIANKVIAEYDFTNANSYIDYEPYTSYQLYLPFIDYIDIPPSEVNGKKLQVRCIIDLATGTMMYYIETVLNDDVTTIAMKGGKIGVDVSWGRDNSVENTRNVVTTAISTAISLYALGGVTGANAEMIKKIGTATTLAKSSLSVMNSLQLRYERGGTNGSLASTLAPSSVYLIKKRNELVDVNEDEFKRIHGLPLYESRVLAQMKGFTIVEDIHLENLGNATRSEMEEIETLLKQGIHL